ncbi:type IV toxin-antitoxin system AbiEi family antitoxin domain-containing protein [Mycobacterium sp. ITM-2016-00316]|uniref:type IV toxin-antitoxin system AbiEi family antitoxin domain-containing protein n=1 Tax=Mycobacterium sp. ITM-2016-00316 TaxID=2099695 RepID=UPI000CF91178|nr:type IV toxin-antitoxin system AbiEi family antitoxin domain-containing protein [Mycobacterium sp. ITM-2016-00316]WNG84841.1 type IV toxin-antitoxin system AbiEi family antitoxin domain-containing protein [Mycobacterium sp. ITM-2016-00316]
MLADLLRDHDGVITLAQARRAGLSQDDVDYRVHTGQWRRCSRGVYFADDRQFTENARMRAGVWAYGDQAAASGMAAAWWQQLTQYPPELVEVTVPRDRRLQQQPGTRLRRRDLDPAEVVERDGLRVTALPLTVVEAAVRRGGGAKLMDSALQRHVYLPALWKAHLNNKGRHGAPAARRLLRAAEDGTRSAAERLLATLLRQAGITGWKANHRVAGYKVDYAFPDAKLILEVDGWAFHSDADVFNHDRVRQNALILAGFQVLRFTWLDLTEYPDRVIGQIAHALAR